MPGSPPRRTREPLTIPPPRTLSSSFDPVKYLNSSSVVILVIGTGSEVGLDLTTEAVLLLLT